MSFTGSESLVRRMVVIQSHGVRVLVKVDRRDHDMRDCYAGLLDELERADELTLPIVLCLIVRDDPR